MTARNDLRRALDAIAFRQRGYFTAAQARDVGYSYQAQKHHADRGNWTRVERGLFRLPGWPVAEGDEYVRACLSLGEGAAISHESALAVHGLSDLIPSRIDVTVPGGRRRADGALRRHVGLLPQGDREERDGWRVTTPERTLVDVAASSTSQEHLDAAVAGALERGLVTVRRLRRRAAGQPDRAALRLERAVTAAVERSEGAGRGGLE